MKTNNAIVNWSNNIVFDGSQTRNFFIRLNWFDCKKRIMQLFSVSTIRATKLKLKLTATTSTKIASPQINCNLKETSLRLYKKECVI